MACGVGEGETEWVRSSVKYRGGVWLYTSDAVMGNGDGGGWWVVVLFSINVHCKSTVCCCGFVLDTHKCAL